MMGRNHAASGLAGAALVLLPVSPGATAVMPAWWPAMPVPVMLLAVVVTGGAAYLPDIDFPSSTVSHSLGRVTKWISKGVGALSRTVYHATAGPRDRPECGSGHRFITHVPVGAVAFGLLVTIAVLAHPIAGAVVVALVTALLANGFVRGGVALLVACGAGAWFVMTSYPGWWWIWGVAVALGCHIHREGDWCTVNGVPRRLWPKMINGRRWDRHSAPFAFKVNSATEHGVAKPLIWVAFGVASVTAAGLAPVVIEGVVAVVSAVSTAVASATGATGAAAAGMTAGMTELATGPVPGPVASTAVMTTGGW